jgi:NAD(P)-dependent dehydrogenase (short-subunit alcohol dehydrogenase family)
MTGKVAVVTGGARGIGAAIAQTMAAEGARVALLDLDGAEAETTAAGLPTPGMAIACDLAVESQVVTAVGAVIDRFGGLDALVNNAGIAGPTAPCEEVSLADWQRTLAVNITGQFLCAQHAIPMLKKSSNASIANLSSAAGRFGYPMRTPYAASKWGVIGFTKSLSGELGPSGIRVNAICPGFVAGPRIEHVLASKAAARAVPIDVVRAEGLAKTSLRRFVTAEDIANAIVFLASPAGANISGHALPVDGDLQSLI